MAKTKKEENELPVEKEQVVATEVANDAPGQSYTAVENDRVTIVIPYVKSKAQGKELMYALRSLERNFTPGANIVVIGDREDWFSDKVTVIEHICMSENPQVDVVEKLKLAIASEHVTDRFIWTNDDIYLLAPAILAHIQLPKIKGLLNPDKFNGLYSENMNRTIALLRENGYRLNDYGTHTPVVYDKCNLVGMFEDHPELLTGGYLLSSVYFNWLGEVRPILLNWKQDQWAMSIVTQAPDPDLFDRLVADKFFLNNAESGYSPWLMSKLDELFPDKSSFEK